MSLDLYTKFGINPCVPYTSNNQINKYLKALTHPLGEKKTPSAHTPPAPLPLSSQAVFSQNGPQ